MYSTNANQQHDGRQQSPGFSADPNGNQYTITIEDTICNDGDPGVVVRVKTTRDANHRKKAYYVTKIIDRMIFTNIRVIIAAAEDDANNQEGKR